VFFSAPVTGVKLNVSDGDRVIVSDVISCLATNTVYPQVSYYWQQYLNESWRNVSDGGGDGSMIILLSTVGVKQLRCVAYNVIGDKTHRVVSDKVTLYVDDKPGKCFQTFTRHLVKHCEHVNVHYATDVYYLQTP